MLRVVFMGTPEFSVPAMEAIHRHNSIISVYTQPDRQVGRGLGLKISAVKTKAAELGLSVSQPEKLSCPAEFAKLRELSPDVIVVVAFGQILKREVLDLPRLGCVNVHSSLLPRWRGAAPIQWAILAGDRETGITTMRLAEKLDAGDILLQMATPVSPTDTAESLHDRLAQMGAELILPTLEGLAQGTLRGRPQDDSQMTYAPKLGKEMEVLDPTKSAEDLGRRVRALNPWPGTSVWIKDGDTGERLKIKAARPHRNIKSAQGRIFEKAGMVLLGTADGALELLRLQWEGKKEVDPVGFLNGLRGKGRFLPLEVRAWEQN